MNRNLKAFTILEALISLILISIIIALSYSLINLMGKQLTLFEKENAQVLEYNLFNTTLKNDIENSNDFEVDKEQLHLMSYNDNEITYIINGSDVWREQQNNVDTFKIHVTDYKFISNLANTQMILNLTLTLLNEKITANYFLDRNMSQIINNTYFNED